MIAGDKRSSLLCATFDRKKVFFIIATRRKRNLPLKVKKSGSGFRFDTYLDRFNTVNYFLGLLKRPSLHKTFFCWKYSLQVCHCKLLLQVHCIPLLIPQLMLYTSSPNKILYILLTLFVGLCHFRASEKNVLLCLWNVLAYQRECVSLLHIYRHSFVCAYA